MEKSTLEVHMKPYHDSFKVLHNPLINYDLMWAGNKGLTWGQLQPCVLKEIRVFPLPISPIP